MSDRRRGRSRDGNSFFRDRAGCCFEDGGARRDRTDDLMLAKHALSQLSYGPIRRTEDGSQGSEVCFRYLSSVFRILLRERRQVGLGRFELPTSRLSSARSNQLSYKPDEGSSRKIRAARGSSTERKGNEDGGKTRHCVLRGGLDSLVREGLTP